MGKRKREQISSLTYSEVSPNTLVPKRVKAHAIRREPSTFVLDSFVKFPNFQKQESKRTLHNKSVISLQLCYHTQFRFRVLHYLLNPQ